MSEFDIPNGKKLSGAEIEWRLNQQKLYLRRIAGMHGLLPGMTGGRSKGKSDTLDTLTTIVIQQATQAQINRFDTKLTAMEVDATEQLMHWQKVVQTLDEQRDEIVKKAHQLADGRRVFKSEDGQRVYDENGNDITGEVHPDEVPDGLDTWESYRDTTNALLHAGAQFEKWHEHQNTLDGARSRLNEGGLTSKEVDDLDLFVEVQT